MTPLLRFLHLWFPPRLALVFLAALYTGLVLAILLTFETTLDATMLYWNG